LPPSLITSKGQCFISACTVESSKRLPINRLASIILKHIRKTKLLKYKLCINYQRLCC
jgi:hypothetical protein